jgi:hypothetical protein
LACCITYGAFLGTELNSNSQSQSEIAAIFATLFLALFCAGFLLEITLALKNRLTSKVENEDWDLRVETTEKITSLREQETLPDQAAEQKGEVTKEKKVPNLLKGGKKERKFKVQAQPKV